MTSDTPYITRYLREHYCLPKYALFFEVPDLIGTNSTRRADAVAVRLDSGSSDITIFEIKVRRIDWLRELKQPEKSACFVKRCNEFYIVASRGVVCPDEVPTGYGWIDPWSSKILIKAEQKVTSMLDVGFMKVLLRRAALNCEKYEKVKSIVQSSLYEFTETESEQ